MRVLRLAVTGACALALLPGAAAQAASTLPPISAAASSCSASTLKIPFPQTVPTAEKPGQAVTANVTVHSTAKVALRRVFFDYELDPPRSHRIPTPSMSWRRGNGAWKALPLPYWNPARHGNGAFWETTDTLAGLIAAHGTAHLELRITFHKGDYRGLYGGQAGFGAPACGSGHELIGFGVIDFYFEP